MPLKDKAARAEYQRLKYLRERDERVKKQRAYNRAHRAEIAEKMRKRRLADPDVHKARTAKYQADNREELKQRRRRKLYGLTPEDYDTLLKKQRGRCAICRSDTPRAQRDWHVDHCHKTGKVRGLLCHKCNVGLGHFGDSVKLLGKAIEYLTH